MGLRVDALIKLPTKKAGNNEAQHESIAKVLNSIDDTLYGMRKRLKFIISVLATQPRDISILDVGCGTGEFITSPLASLGYNIVGIDSDKASIDWARDNNQFSNCKFESKDIYDITDKFEAIILSEVLEHVPDPLPFLKVVSDKLTCDGVLILTVPNGYGPFEIEMKLWGKKFLFEAMKSASNTKRFLKRHFGGRIEVNESVPTVDEKKDSLNLVSGHINFFTYGKLKALMKNAGLHIVKFRKRTVFCGPYSSLLFNYNRLFHKLNTFMADLLPSFLVSDWMFALKKVSHN